MTHLKRLIFLVVVLASAASAQNFAYSNYCQQGGQRVVTSGIQSDTKVQRSYPLCTITVYVPGTTTKVSLYSDATLAHPLSNPFQANQTNGFFQFWAAAQYVDLNFSGSGIASPYTWGNVPVGVVFAQVASVPTTPCLANQAPIQLTTGPGGIYSCNPTTLTWQLVPPGSVSLTSSVTGVLPVANGGSGSASPIPGPGITGSFPTYSTIYKGLDAINSAFCTNISAPDISCVNNAISAGIAINNTIVLSKPITFNGVVNLPGGWILEVMPSLNYAVANGGQISMAVWSKVSCPGGPFATMFNFPTSATSGTGFIDTTAGGNGQGATVEGCGFNYTQPSQPVRTSMIHYPPTILGSQATTFRNLNIFQAWDGISCVATPYCGQMVADNIRISTFDHGLYIDNSEDTVRWNNVHHWPWGFPGDANKIAAYTDANNFGMLIGRVDGLDVVNATFYIGTGVVINSGTGGLQGFGSFTNCGFDTFNGGVQSSGIYSINGGYISTLANPAVGWFMTGGTNSFNGVNFIASGGGNLVNLGGGQLQINGGQAQMAAMTNAPFFVDSANADFRANNMVINSTNVDQAIFEDVGGQMSITNSRFLYTSNVAYSQAKVFYTTSTARGQFAMNTASDVGTGSQVLALVAADSQINLLYNSLLGSTIVVPSSHTLLQSVGNQ